MAFFDFLKGRPAKSAPYGAAKNHHTIVGERFAVDHTTMFDIGATRRLDELFRAPERDSAWLDSFYRAAWNASVEQPNPAYFDGPDGMPYYRFNLPNPGCDFEAQSLSNLVGTCVERNAGAAFFSSAADPETAPQFVMSMGVLDAMLRYDAPDGDPVDREGGLVKGSSKDERQVLTATPSQDFLPAYTARALHRYMSRIWGIDDPRVHLLVDPTLRPSRNLVLGRKRSSFRSSEEVEDEMARLLWFMPPKRALILMPEDWSLAQMDRLSDLG